MSHCGFDFYFPGDFIKFFFFNAEKLGGDLETDLLVGYSKSISYLFPSQGFPIVPSQKI